MGGPADAEHRACTAFTHPVAFLKMFKIS